MTYNLSLRNLINRRKEMGVFEADDSKIKLDNAEDLWNYFMRTKI